MPPMDAALDNHIWVLPLMALLAVIVLMVPMIRLAPFLKLMDEPGGRKQHEGAIPLIGGLVIFPVFIAFAMLAGFSYLQYWPLYVGLFVLLVLGVVDDHKHLHPWFKFGVQCAVAVLLVIWGDAQILTLGNLFGFGEFRLGFMAVPFSLAAVVLLINAVNLMDGLDGLAAGYVSVAIGWIAFGYWQAGDVDGLGMALLLIAAIGGFLCYNMRSPFRKRARVFLGDAGSTCLGFALAWFAIHAAKDVPAPALEPMSVAWILAIPIMDTCAQFYRRVRAGLHPFSPDRGHLHHHFIHAGFSVGKATAAILVLAFLSGGYGVLGVMLGVPLYVLTLSWITAILGHMAVSDKPERYVRALSSSCLFFCLDRKKHSAQD